MTAHTCCRRCGTAIEMTPETVAEAEAEAKRLWGDIPPEEQGVLCDHCFKLFMAWVEAGGAAAPDRKGRKDG